MALCPDRGQTIRNVLASYARANGLPDAWVEASLAISAHENGFCATVTPTDPSGASSWGPWQINRDPNANPNVTIEQANDPVWSTNWRIPGLVAGWTRYGGEAAYRADPVGFMQSYAPGVQVSWPWTTSQAQNALSIARSVMQGFTGGGNTQTPRQPNQPGGGGGSGPSIPLPGGNSIPLPNPANLPVVGGLKDIKDLITALLKRETWERVGIFVIGAAFVVIGAWLALSGTLLPAKGA